MAEFRKKQVVIEAEKFTDSNKNRVFNWITCTREPIFVNDKPALKIRTPDGYMIAHIGDYVIKVANGEFYPVKADVFEETYEPADDVAKMVDKEMAQLAKVRAYTND